MKKIVVFAAIFILWLVYTWPFNPFDIQSFAAGIIASAMVLIIFPSVPRRINLPKLLQPERYLWAVIYMPLLLWHMLRANCDIIYRLIYPGAPLKPAIVKFETSLKSPLARTIFCCFINLAPRTLVMDITGRDIYLHFLREEDKKTLPADLVYRSGIEKILERIFE